jgi:hypothetical protein
LKVIKSEAKNAAIVCPPTVEKLTPAPAEEPPTVYCAEILLFELSLFTPFTPVSPMYAPDITLPP